MKEQADGSRDWLLPLVMVLWIILLMPGLRFALRSGMAFDAGIVRDSIFVFFVWTYPAAVCLAWRFRGSIVRGR
jgi:hypothetical protein